MLCRALLATIAISYLICVLFLSGIQKDDLDVALLKKLQHHNIDYNDRSLRGECENKTIRRSDTRSREDLRPDAIISQDVTSTEKVTSTEHAIEKYSDELNITGVDLDSIVKYLSEATTITVETYTTNTTDTDTNNDNIVTMTETKSSLDKNNTQIKVNAVNPHLKLESLQNILKFWEEYSRRIKTTATPISTTQITAETETTLTTSSTVTKKQDHRNFETKQIDEVERISKLVAKYILSKNHSASVQNSSNDKQIPLTTHAPLDSTSINPRDIEEKFAFLDAINKLNENIAILQNKFQYSVSNNNYNKSTEIVKTTSKLAKGVVIFPRDSVVGIDQNLGNEDPYNQDHHKTSLLQNKRYAAIRRPDHDCTSTKKIPSYISGPLFVESDYKSQNNLNYYKQLPPLNLNADENIQEDAYRDPNRMSFNMENNEYGNTKQNTVSSFNHNSQNESLKASDTNMLLNYPYSSPNAAYAHEESHGNKEHLFDTPIDNKYKIDTDRTHPKSLKHSASENNPKLQNYFNYEKVSSNLKSNNPYNNLESDKNGSPQGSTFKVLQYPNEHVFRNSQTPLGENENRYHKTNQQQTSDDIIGENFKNIEEKTSTFGRDIEQQLVDNFQNKEFKFKYKTITNNTSLKITPLEELKYRYKNTLSQTPIVQNNYSNFKTYQQHPQIDNIDQNYKNFEEQTTFSPRGLKQSIAEETFENYNGQLNQHKYKYTTGKIQDDTVQNHSKEHLSHEQSLPTYKNENSSDKVSLPQDMLKQIAESVKQIILKDLKNEINTSYSTTTSSPLISNSANYKTLSKPVSSIDTTTSTTLMPLVPSTTKYSALNQNQTKPAGNQPIANSSKPFIIASTPRITNLTDSFLKQKIDRFQEATHAIEQFLDLFKQYSTAAQEKTNSVDEKKKHPKLLDNSLAPASNSPPRLLAVHPYDMGLSPKPVFIHHYVAPQIPPPPVPTNLIPGVPVMKPLQISQQANLIHLPQPLMIQTNLNEIQPLRVPILNYETMNIVVPTQTPFKNQEEKNRWNFMLKYGRNPDTRAEIQSKKQSLDAYSHVKSIQYSPPNYEIVNSEKAKHTVNKTNGYTKLNPYLKYIIEKLKVDKDNVNHIIPGNDKYSAKIKNELDKSHYQPVLHQNEKTIFGNNYRGATEADTRYPFRTFNGQPNIATQFASPNKDFSVTNSNEYERSHYRPRELQQKEDNIYENIPATESDTQYLLNNGNSTYYKNMAAQFAASNKDVSVINLSPGYINMIKGFGLNQNIKSAEFDPNNPFYNVKQGVILNKEENVNPLNNKHKENYTHKDQRIYNDNMYKVYDAPKVQRNHYEDDHINSAINNRPKDSNQEFCGQYNEKYMGNHVQITNSMPTNNQASEILWPSGDRIKTNHLPKTLAQSKYMWEPKIFNSLNLHKNEFDPQLKYSSDSLNELFLKKDSKNQFINLENISDSPLQSKQLLTRPPTFKELILQNRLSHPTGRYYDQEESSKYSVNNKGQALISRGPYGTSLIYNNNKNRHAKTPWYRMKERNEKWQQHKARTSAILGGNRYNSKISDEGSHFDSDGNGPKYREYRTQVESSDEKPRYNKKPYYETSGSDKRFGNMNVRGFHEKLEGSDDWRNSHGNIFSRQQVPLGRKPHRSEDMHFKNFLKTQQKVNQMLEKILASKSEGLKSVEAI